MTSNGCRAKGGVSLPADGGLSLDREQLLGYSRKMAEYIATRPDPAFVSICTHALRYRELEAEWSRLAKLLDTHFKHLTAGASLPDTQDVHLEELLKTIRRDLLDAGNFLSSLHK